MSQNIFYKWQLFEDLNAATRLLMKDSSPKKKPAIQYIPTSCVTRTALKVMPPIYFITASEVDVGGRAVEVEPSHQHYIAFCCHVTGCCREVL